MDSRAEMEVVRSTKGSAAGEVSVHVVTTESTVQSTHLPTTAFIIPANATTINLPTSTLEIQRFPREPQRSTGAERPERGAGSEPITATVIPQISGVQTCSTVRVLEWKDGVATLPGSNLRVSVCLPPALPTAGTVVALLGWVPSPSRHCLTEALSEANVSCFLLSVPGCALCLTAPLASDSDVPEQTKLPSAESMCHCDTCGRRHVSDGAREGRGFCSEHCHQQFKERSVIVENSASSTNTTEILKPVKKRKRKDYQSPSEEEYESEQMEKQEERKNSAGDSSISNPEADVWNGSQHGMEGQAGGGVWSPAVGLGQNFGAPAESNSQCNALVHVPEGL
uniref:Uncharacterized protein n=1 Tax=Athene cunicularia TaxID=194338 RepID=A0A663MYD3_ATHCN